jgi:hypothetical protein
VTARGLSRLRLVRLLPAVLAGLLNAACGGSSASSTAPRIELNPAIDAVDVIGLPSADLRALSSATLSTDQWQALLRISVKAGQPTGGTHDARPLVAGRYSVADGVIRFTPLFRFDDGREYEVVFDASKLPGQSASRPAPLKATVARPAVARTPSAVVTGIYPSGGVVPANQLRMYLHFSAPMDWRSGYDHLALLDDRGVEVVDAFLPLEADFWNDDRTRYTVFFDPGRVKRGILPNRQMGRALEAGRRYTLVVKRQWRDGHGLPLKEEFRHSFRAAPAIEKALTMSSWKMGAPHAGTRDPLDVTFPDPLDHGLLRRALGVVRDGKPVEGNVAIESGETRWSFRPREPWTPGEHQLAALEFLEDLAGNRIGRAFEVDNFSRSDATAEPSRFTRPFRIHPVP